MEYKFRAWDEEEKEMLCFGLFETDEGFHLVRGVMIDEMPIMQYTGLKDKNDKEIYEGDILKDDCAEIGIVHFGKLPLDKSGDCVCTYQAWYVECLGKLGQYPTWECQNIGDWMEVIGNIHENPELLR